MLCAAAVAERLQQESLTEHEDDADTELLVPSSKLAAFLKPQPAADISCASTEADDNFFEAIQSETSSTSATARALATTTTFGAEFPLETILARGLVLWSGIRSARAAFDFCCKVIALEDARVKSMRDSMHSHRSRSMHSMIIGKKGGFSARSPTHSHMCPQLHIFATNGLSMLDLCTVASELASPQCTAWRDAELLLQSDAADAALDVQLAAQFDSSGATTLGEHRGLHDALLDEVEGSAEFQAATRAAIATMKRNGDESSTVVSHSAVSDSAASAATTRALIPSVGLSAIPSLPPAEIVDLTDLTEDGDDAEKETNSVDGEVAVLGCCGKRRREDA